MRLKLLKMLYSRPQLGQRELARELGVSLGKVNYCLRVLVEKGHVKPQNLRGTGNSHVHCYQLTERGIKAKQEQTAEFLLRKLDEYDQLRKEIELLSEEVARNTGGDELTRARDAPPSQARDVS